MFWHGAPLSRIERLCMSSFVAHGHPVQLHVYEEPASLPGGITLNDAAKILPRSSLFAHGKSGSFATFADWFRYRLLCDHGGLWCDTDVVCLQPFDYPGEEIYAWQDEKIINNAVLGLPRGHRLAKWMADVCEFPNTFRPYDSFKTRRRKLQRRLMGHGRIATVWGETGPYGLTQAARLLECTAAALPFWHFYAIHFSNWHTLFDSSLSGNPRLLDGSVGLHLWNEMLRLRPGFDKNARFAADSMFEKLCARYL
jgi:hypothetical protein